jgi:hypothetical protein
LTTTADLAAKATAMLELSGDEVQHRSHQSEEEAGALQQWEVRKVGPRIAFAGDVHELHLSVMVETSSNSGLRFGSSNGGENHDAQCYRRPILSLDTV